MTPKIIDVYKFKFCKGTIELHKPGYIIFKDQDNGNIEYYKLSFSLPRPELDLDYITDTDKKEIQNIGRKVKKMRQKVQCSYNEDWADFTIMQKDNYNIEIKLNDGYWGYVAFEGKPGDIFLKIKSSH